MEKEMVACLNNMKDEIISSLKPQLDENTRIIKVLENEIISSIKPQLDENTQILRAMEHNAAVFKAEQDNMTYDLQRFLEIPKIQRRH